MTIKKRVFCLYIWFIEYVLWQIIIIAIFVQRVKKQQYMAANETERN